MPFPPRSRIRQGYPLSSLLFNIILEVLVTAIREEKEIKRIHIRKGEVKNSLFVDDLILYIENHKHVAKKLLELISEFSEAVRHKTNTQKNLTFLYTNKEWSEREIKDIIPFTTVTKRIKYPGMYLPKEAKDLHAENYKMLVKEIKDGTNRRRAIPCSWIEESILWKWLYYPKQSTDSIQSSSN